MYGSHLLSLKHNLHSNILIYSITGGFPSNTSLNQEKQNVDFLDSSNMIQSLLHLSTRAHPAGRIPPPEIRPFLGRSWRRSPWHRPASVAHDAMAKRMAKVTTLWLWLT